jgi:hypothetical protein|nr:MAG TPA: hypothetical protein [Bacteriophage sp.]
MFELILALAVSSAGSVLSWVPGGGLLLIGWQFPGRPWDGERTPRKCTTSQKQHQNRYGLNWENLKKIAEI